jgi:hypothetical protein
MEVGSMTLAEALYIVGFSPSQAFGRTNADNWSPTGKQWATIGKSPIIDVIAPHAD